MIWLRCVMKEILNVYQYWNIPRYLYALCCHYCSRIYGLNKMRSTYCRDACIVISPIIAINNVVREKILKINNDYEHPPLLYPQYPSDIPVFNKFPSPLYQIVYKVIFQTLLVINFHARIFICWTLHSKWPPSTVQLLKSFFLTWKHTEYTTCKYWHFWWSAPLLKIFFNKNTVSVYLVISLFKRGYDFDLILCFVLEK